MSKELRAKIQRTYDEAYNKGNVDVLDDIVASDYIRHQPPMKDVQGVGGYKKFIEDVRSAYSGFAMKVEDILVEGDTTAVRLVLSGKHVGQAPTLQAPPTGKQVEMNCCSMIYWQNGKMVTEYAYNDYLGLVQQFGQIPPPGLY